MSEAPGTTATPTPDGAASEAKESTGNRIIREMLSSSVAVTLGAIVLAIVVGAILIVAADPAVQESAGYFFARPGDFFAAAWDAASSAYVALFQGAIYDTQADTFTRGIRSLTESLTIATPLIFAGLGVALGFRAGLFNIGAQGQIIGGAILGTYLGFTLNLPAGLHPLVALLGAFIGGGIMGAIPGFLKARFGAHEVIVTIMLNNIMAFGVLWVVTTSVFASSTPLVSQHIEPTAELGLLFGSSFRLHWGFVIALLAAAVVWWVLERSVFGFRLRAVGSNPHAAATAGMNVRTITVLALVFSGALAGLAGAMQVQGTEGALTASIAGSIGFDAITVALLGRSKPLGTVLAGILFGALAAGGRLMQTRTGTPIDLVPVLQSLIVLFIAAPPLVRAVFRLPTPGQKRKPRKARSAQSQEVAA